MPRMVSVEAAGRWLLNRAFLKHEVFATYHIVLRWSYGRSFHNRISQSLMVCAHISFVEPINFDVKGEAWRFTNVTLPNKYDEKFSVVF